MEQDLRTKLYDELSAAAEPPIGDLVGGAVRRGRRLRVLRRLRAGGTAVAVLAVLVTGAAFVRGGGGAPAEVAAPVHLVPASPAGLLQLLISALPPGATSHYAADPEQPLIQVYLDRGAGPGMLRVAVGKIPGEAADGEVRVTVSELPDNCVQRTVVTGHHPGGVFVQVNVASCLAWDGTANAPAPQALTVEEARAVAADPRWGTDIEESIETAGAARFPDLPVIG